MAPVFRLCSRSGCSLGGMRISGSNYAGFALALAGFFIGAVALAHPEWRMFGVYMMWASGIAFALLTLNQIWPRPLEAAVAWGRARVAPPLPPANEWVPLADAARQAMDHAHSTITGPILEGVWRKLSDDETDLLHFWAYRVTAQLGVPLWGTKMLSSRVELIPLDDLQGAHFRERATRVDLGNGEPMTDFENLRVKRRDLDAGLAQIASRNWQPDQQA